MPRPRCAEPLERDELELAWLAGIHQLVRESDGRLVPLAPGRVVDGFAGTSVGAAELLDDLDAHAPLLGEVDRRTVASSSSIRATAPLRPGTPALVGWDVGYARSHAARRSSPGSIDGRERCRQLRLVFSMLAGGAPFLLERLARSAGSTCAPCSIPASTSTSATHGRRAIELCIETFGVEQLVYGS